MNRLLVICLFAFGFSYARGQDQSIKKDFLLFEKGRMMQRQACAKVNPMKHLINIWKEAAAARNKNEGIYRRFKFILPLPLTNRSLSLIFTLRK